MPRAYSSDLRERALAAYEGGEGSQSEVARLYRLGGRTRSGWPQPAPPEGGGGGSQSEVARLYRLGERTLSGWPKLAREEGRRVPRPRRGGTKPVGGEAATLAEYADLLADRTGVRRSASALCRALKALGLVRKKRRSRPPSGTVRMSPRRGGRGAPSWPGAPPPASSPSTRPGSTPA